MYNKRIVIWVTVFLFIFSSNLIYQNLTFIFLLINLINELIKLINKLKILIKLLTNKI